MEYLRLKSLTLPKIRRIIINRASGFTDGLSHSLPTFLPFPPGRQIKIAGIDAAITDEHHHNFFYWQKFEILDADMVRIDGHSDMADFAPLRRQPNLNYYKSLEIVNFNCPAVHYGIIGSIQWLNPHSISARHVDYGVKLTFNDPAIINDHSGVNNHAVVNNNAAIVNNNGAVVNNNGAVVNGHAIYTNCTISSRPRIETTVNRFSIYWDPEYLKNFHSVVTDCTSNSVSSRLRQAKKLVLDIDLDGFACDKSVDGTPIEYDGIADYEQRLEWTLETLRHVRRPSLITITRSLGEESYVPGNLVDRIEAQTITGLEKIYR